MLAKIITVALYVVIAFIPLVFTTWNYELFEFPKFIALIVGTCFTFVLAIGDHIIRRANPLEKLWHNTPPLTRLLHISVIAILTTQLLSTATSISPITSIWGYYGRFHQGLITTICYTIIYFIASLYLNKKSTHKLIKISVSTSILISVYAIAEHFGVNKNLWVQDVQNRVFSTLGQPNWLASYLLPNLFLLLYLDHIKTHQTKKYSWSNYLLFAIIFVAFLFTKSRSGLLAFVISYIFYWAILIKNFSLKSLKEKLITYTTISLVLLFTLASPLTSLLQTPLANLEPPTGPALETGGTESGEIRKIVWLGALKLIERNPILGSGPETFGYTYYQTRPVAHNYVSEWDFLYNKAHNEYLNIAANTGLVGLLGYLSFHLMLALIGITKSIKKSKKNNDDNHVYSNSLAATVLATTSSFFITNFFGFSVIPVYLLFTLVASITTTATSQDDATEAKTTKVTWLVILLATLTLYFPLQLYLADYDYARGKKLASVGRIDLALPLLENAHKILPSCDLYLTTLSESYAIAATQIAKDPTRANSEIEPYVTRAVTYAELVLATNPYSQNNLKSVTKTYLSLSSIDPIFYHQAQNTMEKSALLAPTDPKTAYNLALIYSRVGNNNQAIIELKKAISLRTIYQEPYYALTLLYEETGQEELIPDLLEKAKANLKTLSAELNEKIKKYEK